MFCKPNFFLPCRITLLDGIVIYFTQPNWARPSFLPNYVCQRLAISHVKRTQTCSSMLRSSSVTAGSSCAFLLGSWWANTVQVFYLEGKAAGSTPGIEHHLSSVWDFCSCSSLLLSHVALCNWTQLGTERSLKVYCIGAWVLFSAEVVFEDVQAEVSWPWEVFPDIKFPSEGFFLCLTATCNLMFRDCAIV